jgi:phage-related protein
MNGGGKPLVWLHGEVKSPPFSAAARVEAGLLLWRLQRGELWRVVYRVDPDAIVIAEVFSKKTRATPNRVIQTCRRREYDHA